LICCILASALERAGRAANATVESTDAANWRRENSLVLGMVVLLVWKGLAATLAIYAFMEFSKPQIQAQTVDFAHPEPTI